MRRPTPAAFVSRARAIPIATSVPNPAITAVLLTTPATSAFPANPVRHTQMRPDVLTEVTLVLTDAAAPEPVVLPSRLVHHIQMKQVVLMVLILVLTDAVERELVALLIPVRGRPVRAA